MRGRSFSSARYGLALLFGALAAGCSPFTVLNGLSPSNHYDLKTDVPYGELDRQTLDIYTPRAVSNSSPLLVFFYGGGWKDGDKADYGFVASSLTKAGYVVIIPDYRLYPEVVFPAFVDDAARAVAWAMQNAGNYGANTGKTFLMGHSAGAHISGLLVTDRRYLAEHGIDIRTLAGYVGLSGPFNFLPIESGYLLNVFPEENRPESQPINFVNPDVPPTLLIHGTGDKTVYPANSESLAKRLADNGVDVTLKLYDGTGHINVAVALAPPFDFIEETLADSRAFLDAMSD